MDYKQHLQKDKILRPLINNSIPEITTKDNIFIYLCYSILSQQLSTKVAEIIRLRFLNLFHGNEPSAEQILKIEDIRLRSIGLSGSKTNYIKNVARFDLESGLRYDILNRMSDDEIIDYVTAIKGVGRWTAEMLLMFAMGREDVFSVDDLGIRNAMISLYQPDTGDKKAFRRELLQIAEKWRPYRTYACLHLWQWRDKR